MKKNLFFLLFTLFIQFGTLAQSTYYWSIDKRVTVDLNYQIVSVPYEGTSELSSVTSKLGLRSTDVKEVIWVHNKIDFASSVSPASFSEEVRKQIIPSMSIGKQPEPIFLTGEITIQPNERTRIDDIAKKYALTLIKKLDYGPYLLKVSEPSQTLSVANKIHENEDVDWSSPDLYTKTIALNDPIYNEQYYLRNTGQLGGTAGIDIKAEDAWAITKGCYIRVAILDDGIDAHDEWGPDAIG